VASTSSTGTSSSTFQRSAPWLSSFSTKSFYVQPSSSRNRPSSNCSVARTLAMMSSQSRQPLNHIANVAATPGTSGYRNLQANFSTADSQETRLNTPPDHRNPTNDDDKENDSLPDNCEECDDVIGETPEDIVPTHVENSQVTQTQYSGPPEWEDINPDIIVKTCKAVSPETLKSIGVRDFYKSYPSWDKMTQDQKNKSLAWFCGLPSDAQGTF